MNIAFWLAAITVFGVVEAMTVGLYCMWFIIGSAAALLACLLDFSLSVQLVVFLAVSLASLWVLRPIFFGALKKGLPGGKTNKDLVLLAQGVVCEEIDNQSQRGAVKIQGKVWTARSAKGIVIPVGALVIPVEIEGVKLIVNAAEPAETDK